MKQDAEESMQTMEQWAQFVATVTGFKQQLIDVGWDERNAERLVIEMVMKQQ
jgi:hypothetical protein